MPLTLEERERRAYIEGRTEEAGLLAGFEDEIRMRLGEAEQEIDSLREEANDLQWKVNDKDERIGFLESLLDEHDIDYA